MRSNTLRRQRRFRPPDASDELEATACVVRQQFLDEHATDLAGGAEHEHYGYGHGDIPRMHFAWRGHRHWASSQSHSDRPVIP